MEINIDNSIDVPMSILLERYSPYNRSEIYILLKKYESVDLVINGIKDSLKYNINLERACYEAKKR